MARTVTRTTTTSTAPRSNRSRVKNADPLVESEAPTEPSAPQMDYPAHIGTYNRFLNMVKWFIVHLCFLIPALYFFIIQGNSGVGFVLLAIGVVVLLWGLLHNPEVERDVDVAMASRH